MERCEVEGRWCLVISPDIPSARWASTVSFWDSIETSYGLPEKKSIYLKNIQTKV